MKNLSSLLVEKTPKYDITIPSSKIETRFRPFLVKEEKILLIAQNTQSKKDIMYAIKDIIESCVDGIKDAYDLPIFDIEYLFVKIRSKSVGEEVNPVIVCPTTGESITCNVNLDDLDLKRSKDHTTKVKLDKDIIVTMKYPSIRTLDKFGGDIDTKNTSEFYDMIVHCIDSVQTPEETIKAEDTSIEELKEFVDTMTKKQFDSLLEFFVTSPRLEHTINYQTSDGTDRSITLSGLGDFFG